MDFNFDHIIAIAHAGDLVKAEEMCEHLLEIQPNEAKVWNFSSIIALQLNNLEKSLLCSKKAITIDPHNADYQYQAGLIFSTLKLIDQAITHFQTALVLNKNFIQAHTQLANTFAFMGALDDAEKHYQLAIDLGSNHVQLYHNFANILLEQGRLDEAIGYYQKIITTHPHYYKASFNLANALYKKHRYEEALYYYDYTLRQKSDHLESHYYKGLILSKLGRVKKAIEHLDTLLQSKKSAKLFLLLGSIYSRQEDFKNAITTFEKGLHFFASEIELLGGMLTALKKSCSWQNLDHWQLRLTNRIKEIIDENNSFPLLNYQWLGINSSGEEQLLLAKKIAQHHFAPLAPLRKKLNFKFVPQKKSKLKIGYVSSDIRDHATSHLIKNMFSFHNRERFEIFLYSTGPNDQSDYRKKISAQCDHFIDLKDEAISDCSQKIYHDNIDILIDMMGYTEFSKIGIFALKPAPIQISYLAYPGTTGLDTIDYLIADEAILPSHWVKYCSEKVIYLPGTVFITDDRQEIGEDSFSRKNCGLPEKGFIFCSFNHAYKIDLNVFSVWMTILQQVPDSILWLYSENKLVIENLRNEAKKQQITPDRLIFANKLPKNAHLARLKLADLCLDCLAINAGTTAIDALWAGVPSIGYENPNIRLRVARSILAALDMSDLLATNEHEYKDLAIFYATHPQELFSLRERIAVNKKTQPLFQTQQYVKNLETAYEKVWQNYLIQKSENIFLNLT